MSQLPPIRHPGPQVLPRASVAAAAARPLAFEIPAGSDIATGLARGVAAAGAEAAYLDIADAQADPFAYVIPSVSPDPNHAAWYSAPLMPSGGARIARAGAIVGWREGARFVHCHGLWSDRSGAEAMGHMLGPQSILSAPVRATGIALRGARFEQRPDPETNFQLLAATATGGEAEMAAGEALLVTLRPNQDVCETLARICAEAGFARASIHGIGSFNGARFADGAEMTSFASEFLVTEGRFDATAEIPVRLEVAVVALDGQIFHGWLVPGTAPVCVTCEFVLLHEAAT